MLYNHTSRVDDLVMCHLAERAHCFSCSSYYIFDSALSQKPQNYLLPSYLLSLSPLLAQGIEHRTLCKVGKCSTNELYDLGNCCLSELLLNCFKEALLTKVRIWSHEGHSKRWLPYQGWNDGFSWHRHARRSRGAGGILLGQLANLGSIKRRLTNCVLGLASRGKGVSQLIPLLQWNGLS